MWDELLDIYYLRLSKEDGDVTEGNEEESCSIQSQRACIRRYLMENRLHPENFLEIRDDGYSGTTMNRPGMNQLLDLVHQGKVRTIVVRDLSRFARNYLEAGHYLEYVFPDRSVRFISVNDNYDSDAFEGTTGGLDLAIKNLLNQMYSKDISKKIKSAVDLKKLSGEYVYGVAPFGYKKGQQKNTIIVDEPAATVVRRIFYLASEGTTFTEIAQMLNNEGILTPSVYLAKVRGKYKTQAKWSFESVRNIILNRIYTGDTVPFKSHVVRVGSDRTKAIPVDQQIIIPNTHEAIISRELFYQAHNAQKRYAPRKTDPNRESYLFTSKLVCGCCGKKLVRGKAQNKDWRCTTHRYDTDAICKDVRIRDSSLSDIVLRSIQMQMRILDANVTKIRRKQRLVKSEEQVLQEECRRLRQKIEGFEDEKMERYEQYLSGELSKEAFLKAKSQIAVEAETAKAQYTIAESRLAQIIDQLRTQEHQISNGQRYTEHARVSRLDRQLLQLLVKQITVYPEGRIRIIWNFSDELSGIMKAMPENGTNIAV